MLMRSQTVEDKNKNTQQMRQTKVEHNQFSNILSIWLIFSQSLKTKAFCNRHIEFSQLTVVRKTVACKTSNPKKNS